MEFPVKVDDIEGALLSRIPSFPDRRKTEYIGFRGCGFMDLEACRLAGVKPNLVSKWLVEDEEFSKWLSPGLLGRLQGSVSKDVVRLQFFRNMHLLLQVHYKILAKAAKIGDDQSELSEVEIELLKVFGRQYTASDMLAMLKATAHDDAERRGLDEEIPTINVYIGDQAINDEVARRAGSRSLLDQFTMRDNVIDAESTVIPND